MQIEVLYQNHRYEEFDTNVQTSSEPYRSQGTNILTEWNLYLGDEMYEQGIILAQMWHDGNPSHLQGSANLDGVAISGAPRKVGCAILLVAPDELKDIVWLKKDGEKLLWREGDDLINGERFFAMEQLCYSDAATKSINKRAVAVFEYLKNAHPDSSDEELAESMGYTYSAIERILDAEMAQAEWADNNKDEEEDSSFEDSNENFSE